MKILDTISATNIGGRDGKGQTSDGKLDIKFSLAKAFGGKGEGATPEHLFGLGYSACFASASPNRRRRRSPASRSPRPGSTRRSSKSW